MPHPFVVDEIQICPRVDEYLQLCSLNVSLYLDRSRSSFPKDREQHDVFIVGVCDFDWVLFLSFSCRGVLVVLGLSLLWFTYFQEKHHRWLFTNVSPMILFVTVVAEPGVATTPFLPESIS